MDTGNRITIDKVLEKGRARYYLDAWPFYAYLNKYHQDIVFVDDGDTNVPDYHAEWVIEKDQLFLTSISGYIQYKDDPSSPSRFDLTYFFPDSGQKVKADFFTGCLRVPYGNILVELPTGTLHEYEMEYWVEQGRITRKKTIDVKFREKHILDRLQYIAEYYMVNKILGRE